MHPVRIADAYDGELLRFEGQQLCLCSPKAFPPGQPLALRLEPELRLEARAIGSRRLPDGRFELRVRLINLTKDAREALNRALIAPCV